MSKILIAVPTFENITPDTYKSIYNLQKRDGDLLFFDFVRGYDCATARNNIVKLGLSMETDFVLMVDNDVVLPPESLIWLLEDTRDVCLGYYPHRNKENQYGGKTSVCRLGPYNYVDQYSAIELRDMAKRGEYKVQIHGGGAGCELVKTDVYRRQKFPWYKWINYDNGQVLSEDLYFCEQCKQHRIPIYVDTRVGCGHLFRHVQWPV